MLKIKDNVDLKELEKFGFSEHQDRYISTWFGTDYYIYKQTRIIKFNCDDWGLEEDDGAKVLTILFDLIQAGLVEKVE